jgi:ABC-2 type transport system ATP-binding protein
VQDVIINNAQGNSLNLVVAAQSDAISALQQALKAANLPIFGIAQARPSLDDVYLSATGQTLLDADMAAASTRDAKAERKQSMR